MEASEVVVQEEGDSTSILIKEKQYIGVEIRGDNVWLYNGKTC